MNKIKDVTTETIRHLKSVEWFIKCGVEDTQAVIVLHSWEEAIKECSSLKWENLCLEAANSIAVKVLKKDKERYKKWNDVVELVRPYVVEVINEKVVPTQKANNLPDDFIHTVRWDIMHLLLEAEYSDIVDPAFFASHAYWYVNGHFPCGWRGNLKTGKLIIF